MISVSERPLAVPATHAPRTAHHRGNTCDFLQHRPLWSVLELHINGMVNHMSSCARALSGMQPSGVQCALRASGSIPNPLWGGLTVTVNFIITPGLPPLFIIHPGADGAKAGEVNRGGAKSYSYLLLALHL